MHLQEGQTGSSSMSGKRSNIWKSRLRIGVVVVLAVLLFHLILEVGHVLFGRNFHTVIPGKVYRSAQPRLASLTEYVKRYGIRTVINLRGCSPPLPWYQEESQASAKLGVCQEDLYLSAGRLPPTSEIRDLIQILDRAEYPILLHCKRGADRTGLASAITLLLQEGVSYREARSVLSFRYAHICLGHPAFMAEFFDYYKDWLRDQELEHSPRVFRRWALEEYRGGKCGCRFEKWELPKQPIQVNRPFDIRVRVRNSGSRPWHFSPLYNVGQHVIAIVRDDYYNQVSGGRGGLYEARIAPGQVVDVVVPVEPIRKPGRYRLVLDMIDEEMATFFQVGSEPVELRLEVRK